MKAKRSIYNIIFNILSIVVTFALGIIIPKLFIVNLGSEANGLVSSVGQIFSYVGLLEAGIGATVVQALYKPITENDKSRINQILSASKKQYTKIGCIYILCIIVIAVVYPLIVSSELPRWQVIGVVCFSGLGNAINFLLQQNYVVLLSAEGKGYITTNLNLIVNIFVSLTKVVLLLNGFNIVYVTGAQFLITLLRIVFMRVYINKNYKWLDTNTDPDLSALKKQKYVFTQQFSYFIYSNTDIVILTFLSDLTIVSVYTVYNMIIGVIEGIVGSFTSSVVFALGQLYNEDFKKFKKIYKMYDSIYLTIVFALFTVVYLCIIPFLSVYTKDITDVNYVDPLLAFLFVVLKMITTLRSQSQNAINFAGHFKETQNSSIVEAVINIVISVVLVYYIGIYGVVIGSIVSSLYKGIVITNYTNKHIVLFNNKEKGKKYLRWIMYFLVFGIICIISNSLVPNTMESYIQWIKLAVPCTIVVCVTYLIFWAIIDIETTKETIKTIKELISKREVN